MLKTHDRSKMSQLTAGPGVASKIHRKDKVMARIVAPLASALGLVCGLASAAPAYASDTWVAIAISGDANTLGYDTNAPTQQAAESGAMSQCQQNASGCQIAVSGANACAAVALNGNNWHGGVGATPQAAIARAIQLAGGGQLMGHAHCSTDPS
jgi:hypothetical protein